MIHGKRDWFVKEILSHKDVKFAYDTTDALMIEQNGKKHYITYHSYDIYRGEVTIDKLTCKIELDPTSVIEELTKIVGNKMIMIHAVYLNVANTVIGTIGIRYCLIDK